LLEQMQKTAGQIEHAASETAVRPLLLCAA
jgi:hypothetical protein